MPYIVVDLDGTLADNTHRAHLAEAKKWDEFHSLMHDDAVYEDVDRMLDEMQDIDVIFLTARDEKYRAKTSNWLNRNMIAPHSNDRLVMRDRPHHEETAGDFKLRKLKDLEEEFGCKPLFCLEDQMNITLRLRAEGFVVWNVRNSHA